MALTKEDLRQINELFINGINTLIIPTLQKILEWKDEVDEWRGEVDKWRKETDQAFVDVNKSIDNNTLSIGHYFEQCPSKNEHKALEKRVHKIELSRA